MNPRIITRPLGPWLDPVTTDRPRSPFKAAWSDTLDLLSRETWMLGATLVVVQVDVTEADLRRDGLIRANARVQFPGIRVAFESRRGPLTFATDMYPTWQANVRAVALGLEALRRLDRYGITKRGEQYVGWQALPASTTAPMTREEAAAFLAGAQDDWSVADLLRDTEAVKRAYRAAAKRHHSDVGGNDALFARITAARDVLLSR